MLKVAVIGVGTMGRNHARIYHDMNETNLVAVVDSNEETGKEIAKKHHCSYYKDYKEMIKKERPEAVSIATPTVHHFEIAMHIIKKGIPVLIEKPITSKVEEAKKIIAEAKKRKCHVAVGHIERFNSAIIELKKKIKSGQLGQIYKIQTTRIGPTTPRIIDVGVTIDLAVHDIDIMRYLTDSEVKRVYAEIEQIHHKKKEDSMSGLLKFKNGVLGIINVDWITPTKVREISVTGEKGMFVANMIKQELYFYENRVFKEVYDYPQMIKGVQEGNSIKYLINTKEPLRNELESFIDCVKGRCKPKVTANDGLKALEIAIKMIESAKKNRQIEI